MARDAHNSTTPIAADSGTARSARSLSSETLGCRRPILTADGELSAYELVGQSPTDPMPESTPASDARC
jgi:hypothetical protein